MNRVVAVIVALGLLACHEDQDASPPAEITSCSTGPARDPSAPLPPREDHSFELPPTKCALRCGDTSTAYWGASGGPEPTFSALPSGPCTNEPTCGMHAVKPYCPVPGGDPTPRGALFNVECSCVGGSWECRADYFSGGAGIFPPDCPDASTYDAATPF